MSLCSSQMKFILFYMQILSDLPSTFKQILVHSFIHNSSDLSFFHFHLFFIRHCRYMQIRRMPENTAYRFPRSGDLPGTNSLPSAFLFKFIYNESHFWYCIFTVTYLASLPSSAFTSPLFESALSIIPAKGICPFFMAFPFIMNFSFNTAEGAALTLTLLSIFC